MKRKLVEYEVFEKMRGNSLTSTIKELVEAEDHLARSLEVDEVKLNSFDESTVIYEQSDGTYLRANYSVNKDNVKFENVEQLVIDEDSEKQEGRNYIKNMLEAILDDKDVEANDFFSKYLDLNSRRYKRDSDESLDEASYARLYGSPERTKGKSGPVISVRHGSKNLKKSLAAKAAHRRHRSKYLAGARKRKRHKSQEKARRPKYKRLHGRLRALNSGKAYTGTKKKMNEWIELTTNVSQYIDFMENSHVIAETSIHTSEDGTTDITIPNTRVRNEGKVLKMHFDNMLKTDVKVLRESARRLTADHNFCQMVADVKRQNGLSDDKALEETISNLVRDYPGVLYLTQEELASMVGEALANVGVKKYDDQMCNFISEGILRVAHDAYGDRVQRIYKLANTEIKESNDKYADFQKVISGFFPKMDESARLEMKMFEDLYNVAVDVRKLAFESENDVVRAEAQEFIAELEDVLNGRQMPDLGLAAEVADWIDGLTESNLPGASEDWSVVKTPHKTVSGDHPQMAKNARVPGIPANHMGYTDDPAPMIGSDSNAWNHGNEARNRSWGNSGGKEVWPDLSNPHVPKPFGDYKMKGDDSVGEDGFGTWGSDSTWPALQNPYIPAAVMPKQKVQPDNPVE